MSADDAIAAYTEALRDNGFQKVDAPGSLPIDDVKQGAYIDVGNKAFVVEALGPKAFDDKSLKSAKGEVPPNTTVVWLIPEKA